MIIHVCIYRCGKFKDQSSICYNYTNNDVYTFNQSNQITKALGTAINVVTGSYCREKAVELLCNYLFPKCTKDTGIVPICGQSCAEYLDTGICVNHSLSVLMILNTEDFSTVNGSLHMKNNCYPYNTTVSNNCTLLTREYARKLTIAVYIIGQSIA